MLTKLIKAIIYDALTILQKMVMLQSKNIAKMVKATHPKIISPHVTLDMFINISYDSLSAIGGFNGTFILSSFVSGFMVSELMNFDLSSIFKSSLSRPNLVYEMVPGLTNSI